MGRADRRNVGALAFYDAAPGVYTAEHGRLALQAAAQAAPAVVNAIAFELAQEQSLTDLLTQLPNRRYVDRHLAQELSRAQRGGTEVSLLLLDMDRFKSINDEYGREAGDRALVEVAMSLRSGLRSYDICARLAGDDFAVVLPGCDRALATRKGLVKKTPLEAYSRPKRGGIIAIKLREDDELVRRRGDEAGRRSRAGQVRPSRSENLAGTRTRRFNTPAKGSAKHPSGVARI